MPSTIYDKNGDARDVDMFDFLPPLDGEIHIYYGRIGCGKTYAGTRNILKELRAGQVVVANWHIKWEGYDERDNLFYLILGALGLKKEFYSIPRSNFHHWDISKREFDGKRIKEDFVTFLSSLTDMSLHLDEGHLPFDSYEGKDMTPEKRSAVFSMRHFNRRLTVYTQRANSVHINLRGNTNRFFKCEKILDFPPLFFRKLRRRFRLQYFLVTEFQDLTSSSAVDESRLIDPETGLETGPYKNAVSSRSYWGRKKYFEMYDSKYLRDGAGHSHANNADLYFLSYGSILRSIWSKIKRKK